MPQFRNLERPWLISAMLALAVFAAYLPVYFLGFINFDDNFYVTGNLHVQQGLTWESVRWAFTHFHAANWHPLTWLSHMLDCQIYGLHPLGHHVTNVLFHAANTVILFLWLRSMTGAVWRSALVAALFGLHPLRVESVAWVAERKDVLCAFFGLLSLWAYARYAKAAKSRNLPAAPAGVHPIFPYALSLSLFALGLLSKPMLVTWPFVMLLLDYWPLDRMAVAGPSQEGPSLDFKPLLRLMGEKIPFLALSVCSCVITFFAQRSGGAISSLGGDYGVPLEYRFTSAPLSYMRYLMKLAWPHDLAIIYPLVRTLPEEQLVISAIVVPLVCALVIWRARRNPYLLVGWFWFLGTAVPIIGLVQVGTQSIADRYTYVPTIGVLIMLVWGLGDLAARWRRKGILLPAGATVVVLVCAFLDGRQLLYWQNPETLFRHALAVTPDNFTADNVLGSYFSELGELEPAKVHYRAALMAAPELRNAWNNLGCALVAQKHYEEAIDAFRALLRTHPDSADAHSNMGNALMGLGRVDEALEQYREAVRLEPDNALARFNLGAVLIQTNRLADGVEQLQLAVKLNPKYADAHISLANAYIRQGKPDEAAAEFRSVLAINPASLAALDAYAALMSGQGRWGDAVTQYRAALKASPDMVEALNNLAWILAANPDPALRNGPEAVKLAERACQLTQYKQAIMIGTLAAAYAEAGRFPDAVKAGENAKALADAAGEKEVSAKNAELLALYRSGRPFRDTH